MRNPRQALAERAIVRSLLQCGSYPCPEDALKTATELAIGRPLTQGDFDESMRYLEYERRIIGTDGETARVWKLTEGGRLWAAENRV